MGGRGRDAKTCIARWNRQGNADDFIDIFKDWHFDWLDIPGLIEAADFVLEYPMVDQEPLERWSFGTVTLLGDAAHPMVPRGSNGAGQAILDAVALREAIVTHPNEPETALKAYELDRLPVTGKVVLANRITPPDVLIKVAQDRAGDNRFNQIEDVISKAEIDSILSNYRDIAGLSEQGLRDPTLTGRP